MNFWVRFITAIAVNPNIAFKNIDFKNLWLFICNMSKTNAQIDNQIIAIIPRVFKKSPHIKYMWGVKSLLYDILKFIRLSLVQL